jgi:hypothetical protein
VLLGPARSLTIVELESQEMTPLLPLKIHAGKIRAGIHQQQHARTGIAGNLPAPQKRLRVSVHANARAPRIPARSIALHRVRAEEVALSVRV